MNKRILLVEDESGLVLTLTDRLTSEGYSVETAADGEIGFKRGAREGYDLIILDVMLPGRNGFDVCRDLRQRGVQTPILMLTARGQVTDKVVGLKLGADDYLAKPFETIELMARIEALLRRSSVVSKATPEGYVCENIEVDFRRAEVRVRGQLVEVSAREYELLRYFIEHRGATLTRNELLDAVWGYEATISTRTVDVHVAWLRRKLERHPHQPELIKTVPRLGYKFVG
jgi:two-component system alkaline phosphatase synthesis response regulator PhoP